MKSLAALLLSLFSSSIVAQASEFDKLNARADRYHSSGGYQQKLRKFEADSAAVRIQNYNSKILNEAKAFAKYHGGSIGLLSVRYSTKGTVESIDMSTRDGLTARCIDYAFRLTCDCVNQRTFQKWRVEFRGEYGGVEKGVYVN